MRAWRTLAALAALCGISLVSHGAFGAVISYSTYLGGFDDDDGRAVAVDALGNAYVVGETRSPNFPTKNAFQSTYGGGVFDIFVAKFAPDGSLVYATYIGGSDDDRCFAVAVDAGGNVYLTGRTASPDFPVVAALQPTLGGSNDAYLVKLDPTGAALVFSTYLGGSGDDRGLGVATDAAGGVYITGLTLSGDFPTVAPTQAALLGPDDAFVARLPPAGDSLVFSTYFGGTGSEAGRAIALDGLGRIHVVGQTRSGDFPTLNPLQPTLRGEEDAYAALFSPLGVPLFATYLGGSASDSGLALALDSSGGLYITGQTESSDFPVVGAIQSQLSGNRDAFVAKLADSAVVYATYLGGGGEEFGEAIAVGADGRAYVVGDTSSGDFPVPNAVQNHHGGGTWDAFVAALSPGGSRLVYGTYLGGNGGEFTFDRMGVALDASGAVFAVGHTTSVDFPTVQPAQSNLGGFHDTFVTKISPTVEVSIQLLEVADQVQLSVTASNRTSSEKELELRLWLELAAAGVPPFSIVGGSVPLTLPPSTQRLVRRRSGRGRGSVPLTLAPSTKLSVIPGAPLPGWFPASGFVFGARLQNIATGETVAESICTEVPCAE